MVSLNILYSNTEEKNYSIKNIKCFKILYTFFQDLCKNDYSGLFHKNFKTKCLRLYNTKPLFFVKECFLCVIIISGCTIIFQINPD